MKIRLSAFMTAAVILIGLIGGGCVQQTDSSEKPFIPVEEKEMVKKDEFVSAEDAVKNALKAGDKMPSFNLPNAKNEQVSSDELLKKGNLVVVFYRGQWCPFCNLYLKKLQKSVKEINANGGELVAISVENPDNSLTVQQKNELDFTVLSDKNLDLARKFKLVFQLPKETDEKYKGKGIDLVERNGTEKPELPIAATYIVKQDGEIFYAFLDQDFKKRLQPEDIIENLKKLKAKKSE